MLKTRLSLTCAAVLCACLALFGCGTSNTNSSAASGASATDTGSTAANSGSATGKSAGTDYPKKDITLIIPWAAGGGTDVIGRQVASLMEKQLGKPIVVVNRNGGGGLVGFQEIAKAKPDGYTIGLIRNSLILQKYAGETHVDHKSFEPIAVINQDAATITVSGKAPWASAKEFIDAAKKEPEKIRISNSGPGAIWHVAALALGRDTGAKFTHVPFQGGNPAAIAVAGNHVEATTASAGEVQSLVQDGSLKMLGIASEQRLPQFPDVPTLKEQGINTVIGVWRGLVAPKGTPPAIVEALDKAVAQAVASNEYKAFMNTGGYGILHVPAKDFGAFMDKDDAAYGELFKEINAAKK
ncbi:tripartite tricarboxylate transporter substrate binding protein [Paenibacillus xerothermodurans]|uniref:Tripartite tricarboxylate transporter substrate binding protein n=1 Tax=Paenibacillus xerothermodurans TaxID=1977292 RepID=A0A2W1P3R2_PAEXE|nr:tripartite tricarboxylate transporter substrate binding protein [Paenibacillus xerothermodurans]PZE22352.1 tripartite tricarboxylate transporter substrate binding protein [Paenibacillus xerothermodurans]